MSSSDECGGSGGGAISSSTQKKYKGVRCRKWGKWVSEIRVPGTKDRLWLGSYATCEAAAVAYDIASYCLRGPSSVQGLNFPLMLPPGVGTDMSPRSIQKAASDAGMAVDAQLTVKQPQKSTQESSSLNDGCGSTNWEGMSGLRENEALNISVDDYL
ncbi:ethylene-responsive transcription factor ERF019-like [Cornus florida]|uniref:ethylene-responsive transcription factor ERF019-like n=1 Tax=Cornus florida TaxID=4283 RepID=UPI00289F201A|nr:ethylene-responsive transcription factor ERF019-like [Cornus florida]